VKCGAVLGNLRWTTASAFVGGHGLQHWERRETTVPFAAARQGGILLARHVSAGSGGKMSESHRDGTRSQIRQREPYMEEEFAAVFGCCGAYFDAHLA
jgi:hypothetical protein